MQSRIKRVNLKGLFHGLAHVQAITLTHLIPLSKKQLEACNLPLKISSSFGKSVAIDVFVPTPML